jgi:fatty-acyl-CoA synthase
MTYASIQTHETSERPPIDGGTEASIPPGDQVVEALVNRALTAQRQIEGWSEEQVDALLRTLSNIVADHAQLLAVAAVAETGMGNINDKTLKNRVASTRVYAELAGQIGYGEIAFDSERQVAEIASPVGVVVGLVPATHPVATFIFKVLIALKGRNAIILSPSRRAWQVSEQVGGLIHEALRAIGAPSDLVQWPDRSSREITAALMSHSNVGLVLATGGQEMVRAAYRSGTPAIGVGPGNAPALISADADLRHAARSVVTSKSFDNGLICGAENHLVVEAGARARLIAELVEQGAAVLTTAEMTRTVSDITRTVTSGSSYVHGACDQPLIGATVGEMFDTMALMHSWREALIVPHQHVRWTYAGLKRRVDELALGLMRLGLEPGDRLGIWSPNRAEWVLTQFAAAKAGLVLVNINPAYMRGELEYALNKVECKALILASGFKGTDYVAILQSFSSDVTDATTEWRSASLPSLRHVIRLGAERTPGLLTFDDLLRPASAEDLARLAARGARLQFDDPINIQFTSGTTGVPKGATLTHHNILNNAFFVGEAVNLGARDRVCIPVPLYHCFGMVIGVLGCMTHGAAMLLTGESFDALAVLRTVQAERCTALYGVPTMFNAALDHPRFAEHDLSSLRTGIMGGSPCPVEVMRRVTERMHMQEVTIAYGMTETSPVSFQSSIDDALERRVSTVGRIQPHVEAKVVDADGRIVPRGQKGELLTRGYSVMLGYWGDETRSREAIDAERWMHTGDLATIDDHGYCTIAGRVKDMVIRGGENIYPREIEEFLYQHPKIRDVQCVGVPDTKYGEELCACVITREGDQMTEQDIRDFCDGRIARFKIPRYVRFMAAYPMTVTGKVAKYLLREQVARELGVQDVEAA